MATPNLWAQWRAATAAVEKGQHSHARLLFAELYQQRASFEPDFRVRVCFSYAVALIVTNGIIEGQAALFEIQDGDGFGSRNYDAAAVANEIAFTHNHLGEWRAAERQATTAVDLYERAERDPNLALTNRGVARRARGNLTGAEADLLRAVETSLAHDEIVRAAIAGEQLARTLVLDGRRAEASAWAALASSVYRARAPHHLQTLSDLLDSLADDAPASTMPGAYARLATASAIPAPLPNDCLSVLDLNLLRFVAAIHEQSDECRIDLVLTTPVSSRASDPGVDPVRLAHHLVGDIEAIRDYPGFGRLIAGTYLARRAGLTEDRIPSPTGLLAGTKRLQRHEADGAEMLHWEHAQAWPDGLAWVLSGLAELYRTGFIYLARLHAKVPDVQFLSLSARTWPRPIQARYLGLGQYDTGFVDVPQHLIEDLVYRQLRSPDVNVSGFKRIGYPDDIAEQLSSSQLVSILPSSLHFSGPSAPTGWGGLPLNEFNIANPPSAALETGQMPGFLLDAQYQSPFFAPVPGDIAFYGTRTLFRDHFEAFREGLTVVGTVRAKHYAMPVYEVSSIDELHALAERLPEFERIACHYRGQTSHYNLPRAEVANRILYGTHPVAEPSLPGASPRRGYDYATVHPLLQVMVQDFLYETCDTTGGSLTDLLERWEALATRPAADWDIAVMALAQHYGLPTPGIDITTSIDIALWFATNRFVQRGDGHCYVPMREREWPDDPARWPVVYFILPVANSLKPSIRTIHHLEDLGLDARRPHRQAASFFMGADSIHRNRLAEALVCVVRLRPGDWTTRHSYRELFPPESEDPAYRLMLSLREQHASGPLGHFFTEIVRYVEAEPGN